LAFTQKLLNYQFALAGGGSAINISGLRSTCKISTAGAPAAGGLADIAIYGMTLSQTNSLTLMSTRQTNGVQKNEISVQAGDANGMSLIFKGTVVSAWAEAKAMPEVCFRISAYAGAFEAIMPSEPTSIQGSGDVAQIAQQLAQKMGLQFENNNVQVKLSNPYFSGSYRTQMQTLAEHAGIQWIIDRGTLAIWPTGQYRKGDTVLISKDTGMVGYPAFNQAGVTVTCLFNPAVQYGRLVQVQSDFTPANGQWSIYQMIYDLESITPHGAWFIDL
jgi:hypothetical protein